MAKVQDPERRRVAVNVSLDLGLLARLDAAAEREGTSRSDFVRQLLSEALDDEEAEDALLAAEAEEADSDPDNQGRIHWEQVKAESKAGPAARKLEDRLDAAEIERVLADPDEEWMPLEDVLAESKCLP